jgi:hypothetical protein
MSEREAGKTYTGFLFSAFTGSGFDCRLYAGSGCSFCPITECANMGIIATARYGYGKNRDDDDS